MLAEWGIPPTDPSLGKMNYPRWVMADQMLKEKERRFVRRIARLLGTDLDLTKDEVPEEVEFGTAPAVFPLAGLLNPEAFKKFLESDHTSNDEDAIPEDQYEAQALALEKNGQLSDIDLMGDEIDQRVAGMKRPENIPPGLIREED